jgi:integrase
MLYKMYLQVRAGEIVTSARAIDEETLKKLYDFNLAYTDSPAGSKRKAEMTEAEKWGGEEVRTMLQPLYLIAFLCLLRFDEALRIQWSWIKLEKIQNPSGKWMHMIRLEMPFRKTHQTGGMHT